MNETFLQQLLADVFPPSERTSHEMVTLTKDEQNAMQAGCGQNYHGGLTF